MDPMVYQAWLVYLAEQPFGELREDARHGIRAAMFHSAHRGKGSTKMPQDFVPWAAARRQRRLSPEETVDYLITKLGGQGVQDLRPQRVAAHAEGA